VVVKEVVAIEEAIVIKEGIATKEIVMIVVSLQRLRLRKLKKDL
jgi:hypothetical protein